MNELNQRWKEDEEGRAWGEESDKAWCIFLKFLLKFAAKWGM